MLERLELRWYGFGLECFTSITSQRSKGVSTGQRKWCDRESCGKEGLISVSILKSGYMT